MTADVALVLAIGMALAFAVTNGFHDAANAIATLVGTRTARPIPAVAMASVFNLLGPLFVGAAVANTVAHIVTVPPQESVAVIGAGLTGAVIWNTFTWRRGLPSSSGHALVGGLVGAALLDNGLHAVNWGPIQDGQLAGVFGVLIGLFLASCLGFVVALVLERFLLRAMDRATTRFQRPVRGAQWVASAWLAFSHGSNDAQKAVGIIAALLVASGHATSLSTPVGITLACSLALTLGTALGGWSIVRTIGRRIFPLRSLDGLVSQTASAGVILAASIAGAPVSTTQVVATSIVGIGVGRRRWRHVGWGIVGEIGVAWLTTMPAAGIIAAIALPAWKLVPGG
jgi:inorganic phosphate transporter, PiT family